MANSKRRLPDQGNKMFIPYNIGGGTGDDHFISGGKLGLLVAILVVNILIILNYVTGSRASIIIKLLIILIMLFVDMYLIRFFVLNEPYYYKLYKRLENYRVTSPGVFWDIVAINETPDGAQLTYTDLKTAMMVRLERDTITGKNENFKETHYDAISDFYRLLNINGYSFVQMNFMEQAGKDPRLAKLDELVMNSENENISKLMEMQIAYIKSITRATLYESEYLLIYTRDTNKARYMASEINDILYKILDGAYVGFRIMEAQEIMELIKEMYGVKLFDPGEAMLNVFSKSGNALNDAFELRSVTYENGKVESFELREEKLERLKKEREEQKNAKKTRKNKKKSEETTSTSIKSKNKKNKKDKNNTGTGGQNTGSSESLDGNVSEEVIETPQFDENSGDANFDSSMDIREQIGAQNAKKPNPVSDDFMSTYGDDLEIDL